MFMRGLLDSRLTAAFMAAQPATVVDFITQVRQKEEMLTSMIGPGTINLLHAGSSGQPVAHPMVFTPPPLRHMRHRRRFYMLPPSLRRRSSQFVCIARLCLGYRLFDDGKSERSFASKVAANDIVWRCCCPCFGVLGAPFYHVCISDTDQSVWLFAAVAFDGYGSNIRCIRRRGYGGVT